MLAPNTDPSRAVLNPFVIVEDAPGLIEFVTAVFGVAETAEARTSMPDGKLIHSEVRLGTVELMIVDRLDGVARASRFATGMGSRRRHGARARHWRGLAFSGSTAVRVSARRREMGGEPGAGLEARTHAEPSSLASCSANARMSSTSRSGACRDAKCPPRSYSLQRMIRCARSVSVRTVL